MTLSLQVSPAGASVIDRLAGVSGVRGAVDLRQRLYNLARFFRADLAVF